MHWKFQVIKAFIESFITFFMPSRAKLAKCIFFSLWFNLKYFSVKIFRKISSGNYPSKILALRFWYIALLINDMQ